MLAVCVAGCRPDPYQGKIKLRYMAWGNPEQMALEEQFCEQFNRENPDLHVSFLRVPGSAYGNKAVVMFASRTAPDVVRVDHYDFPRLVRKNYFLDMAPLAKKDPSFRFEDYNSLAVGEGRYQGGVYGMNVLFGGVLVYYNKSMVREAGLEDPYDLYRKGQWTWDAFRRYAIAMTKTGKNGRIEQFGCTIPSFPTNVPVIWAFGGELLTDDMSRSRGAEGGTAKALKFLSDLRWKDHCAPTPAQQSNSAYTFESGQMGMVLDWMGMTPRYRSVVKSFDWDICPIPKGPHGGSTIVKGNQLVIYRESEHPEAAWRFVRFMTSEAVERKLYIDRRRCLPTLTRVAHSKEFLTTNQPPFHVQAFLDAIGDAKPLPINYRWSEWTREFGNGQDDLYSGRETDAEAAMKRASAKIDEVLADEDGF